MFTNVNKKRKTEPIAIRLDTECLQKIDFICNHFKIGNRSEAIREAVKEWVADRLFTIKLRGFFLEEDVVKHSNSIDND